MKKVIIIPLILVFLTTITIAQQDFIDVLEEFGGECLFVENICKCIDTDFDAICDVCVYGADQSGECLLPADKDVNGDGVINQCDLSYKDDLTQGPAFYRGDSNNDESVDLTDSIYTLNYLFLGGPSPGCNDAADVNNDGKIDLTDAVYGLNFLFLGGPPPVVVFPYFYDGIVEGVTCKEMNRGDCFRNRQECVFSETNNECTKRFRGDEWTRFGGWQWCDIYANENGDHDELTCENGISYSANLEVCEREQKDENRNGFVNEDCPNMPPLIYAMAPKIIDVTPAPFEQSFRIINIDNEKDYESLEILLVSGIDGSDINIPESLGSNGDFFIHKPTVDMLNRFGNDEAVLNGWPHYWSSFDNWQKFNYEDLFSPGIVHKIRFRVIDSGGLENNHDVDFRYGIDEEGLTYVWRDQIIGTIYDEPEVIPREGECSCQSVKVCLDAYDLECQNDRLPFPYQLFSVEEIGNTHRSISGAMEVLGKRDNSVPALNDLLLRDEIGVGKVNGLVFIDDDEIKDSILNDREYYSSIIKGDEVGIPYTGLHYQAGYNGDENCPITEYVRISTEDKYLTDSEWKEKNWPLNQLSSFVSEAEYYFTPRSEIENSPHFGSHAGFYTAPNDWYVLPRLNALERYSSSYGYGESNKGVEEIYFANRVKKVFPRGAGWQNTLMHSSINSDEDVFISVIGVVGDLSDMKCAYQFDVRIDDNGIELLGEKVESVI